MATFDENSPDRTTFTLTNLRALGKSVDNVTGKVLRGAATGFGTSFTEGSKALIELAGFAIPDAIEKPIVNTLDKATEALTFGSQDDQKDLSYKIGSGLGNIASFFVPSAAAGKVAQVAKFAKATKAIEAANLVGAAAEGENLIKLGAALKGAGFGRKAVQEAVEVSAKAQKITELSSLAAANVSAQRAALATSSTFGSLLESGEAADRAREAKVSEGKVYVARLLGLPIGALEGISNSRFLTSFGASFTKKVGESIATQLPAATLSKLQMTALEVLKSSGVEGLEEWSQNTAQNLVAKGLYKPDQELFKGSGEAAMLGALTGGIFDISTRVVRSTIDRSSKVISESKPITTEDISKEEEVLKGIVEEENRTLRANSFNVDMLVSLAKLNFLRLGQAGQKFNKAYIEKFKKENLNKIALKYNLNLEDFENQFGKLTSAQINAINQKLDKGIEEGTQSPTDVVNDFLGDKYLSKKGEIPVIRSEVEQTQLEDELEKVFYGLDLLKNPTKVISEEGKLLNEDQWYTANKYRINEIFKGVFSNKENLRGLDKFRQEDVAREFFNKLYQKEVRFKQTELETTGKKLPKPADPIKADVAFNRYLKEFLNEKEDQGSSPEEKIEKLNDYVAKFSSKILKGVKKEDNNLLLLNEYQNNLDTIKNNTEELEVLSAEEDLDNDQIARKKILEKELNDLPIENEQVKKKFYNENRKAFESPSLKAILGQKDVSSIFLGYADDIFNSALENYTDVSGEVQETKIPTIPQSEFIPPEKARAASLQSKQEIRRTQKNNEIGVVNAKIANLQTQIKNNPKSEIENTIKIAELKKEKQKLFSELAVIPVGRPLTTEETQRILDEEQKRKLGAGATSTSLLGMTMGGKPQTIVEKVDPKFDITENTDRNTKKKYFRVTKNRDFLNNVRYESRQEAENAIQVVKRAESDKLLNQARLIREDAEKRLLKERRELASLREKEKEVSAATQEAIDQRIQSMIQSGRLQKDENGNWVMATIIDDKKGKVKPAEVKEKSIMSDEEVKQKIAAIQNKRIERLREIERLLQKKTPQELFKDKIITKQEMIKISEDRKKQAQREAKIAKLENKSKEESGQGINKVLPYSFEIVKTKKGYEVRRFGDLENTFKTTTEANESVKESIARLDKQKEIAQQESDRGQEAYDKSLKELKEEEALKELKEEEDSGISPSKESVTQETIPAAPTETAPATEAPITPPVKVTEETKQKKKKKVVKTQSKVIEPAPTKIELTPKEEKVKQEVKVQKAKESKKPTQEKKKKVKEQIVKQNQDEKELTDAINEPPAKTEEGSQKNKKKKKKAAKKLEEQIDPSNEATEINEEVRSESKEETGPLEDTNSSQIIEPASTKETEKEKEPRVSLANQLKQRIGLFTEAERLKFKFMPEQERKEFIDKKIDEEIKPIKNVLNKWINVVNSNISDMFDHLNTYYANATQISAIYKALPNKGRSQLKAMINTFMAFNPELRVLTPSLGKESFMKGVYDSLNFDGMSQEERNSTQIAFADYVSRKREIEKLVFLEEYNKVNPEEKIEAFFRQTTEDPNAERDYNKNNPKHYMSRFSRYEVSNEGINQLLKEFGTIIKMDQTKVNENFEKANLAIIEQNKEVLKLANNSGIIDKKLFDILSKSKYYIPFITIAETKKTKSDVDSITEFVLRESGARDNKNPQIFTLREGGLGSIIVGSEQLGLLLNNWQHMIQYSEDNKANVFLVKELKNVPMPDGIKRQELNTLRDSKALNDPTKLEQKLDEFRTKRAVELSREGSTNISIMVSEDGVKNHYNINDSRLRKIINKDMYTNLWAGGSDLVENAKGLYTALITIEPNFRIVNVIQGLGQGLYTSATKGLPATFNYIKNTMAVWKLLLRTSGKVSFDYNKLQGRERELYETVEYLKSAGALFGDSLTTSIWDKSIADSAYVGNKNFDKAMDIADEQFSKDVHFDMTSVMSWLSLPKMGWNKFLHASALLEHGARTAAYLNETRSEEYIKKTQEYATQFATLDMSINSAHDKLMDFQVDNTKEGDIFNPNTLDEEKKKEFKKLRQEFKELLKNKSALQVESSGFYAVPIALARTVDIDFSNRTLNQIQNQAFVWLPFWRTKSIGVTRIGNVVLDSVIPNSVIEQTKAQIESESNSYIKNLEKQIKDSESIVREEVDEKRKETLQVELDKLKSDLELAKQKTQMNTAEIDKSIAKRVGRSRVFRNVLYAHILMSILQDVLMAADNDDSEENTPAYKKFNYFRFPIGKGNGKYYINVPMTFGVGALARTLVDASKIVLKPYWNEIDPRNTISDKSKSQLVLDLVNALINEQESVNRPNPTPISLGALGILSNLVWSRTAVSPLTGAPYLPTEKAALDDRSSYKGKYMYQSGPLFDFLTKWSGLGLTGKSPIEIKRWSSDFLGSLHDSVLEPINILLDEGSLLDYKNSVGKPKWRQAARMLVDTAFVGTLYEKQKDLITKSFGPAVDAYKNQMMEIDSSIDSIKTAYTDGIRERVSEEQIVNGIVSNLSSDYENTYRTLLLMGTVDDVNKQIKRLQIDWEDQVGNIEGIEGYTPAQIKTEITKLKREYDYAKLKLIRLHNREINKAMSEFKKQEHTKEERDQNAKELALFVLGDMNTVKKMIDL